MKLLSADTIRRCFIADPGMSIFSADFDQIELRVIAALAGEQKMIEAAKAGVSLHLLAANQLFGEDHTPDQYKLAKNINFTWAFGGGASTMSRRYGISMAQSSALIQQYESEFSALKAFKKRETENVLRSALDDWEYKKYKSLRSQMFNYRGDTPQGMSARRVVQIELKRLCYRKTGHVITPFGRRLIVDAEKPYTAVNYQVQSSAADIMKHALLDVMDDPELEPMVLLPIHDELLAQAPKAQAEWAAQRFGEVMSRDFMGVPITASGKVYGRSWGHGYRRKD
jgi:DNA polymerase-1